MTLSPQHRAILEYLKTGKTLTGLEALKLFGTMKLASRVSELKDMGYNIQSKFIITGQGKRISQYWLADEPTMPDLAENQAKSKICPHSGPKKGGNAPLSPDRSKCVVGDPQKESGLNVPQMAKNEVLANEDVVRCSNHTQEEIINNQAVYGSQGKQLILF